MCFAMTNLEFAVWAGLVSRRASAWAHDILTSGTHDAREVSIQDFCDDIRDALRGLEERSKDDAV